MLLLAYQALKEPFKISRRGKLLSVVSLVLSAIYLYTKDFTYLPKKQPEALTLFINSHFIAIVTLMYQLQLQDFIYTGNALLSPRKKRKGYW